MLRKKNLSALVLFPTFLILFLHERETAPVKGMKNPLVRGKTKAGYFMFPYFLPFTALHGMVVCLLYFFPLILAFILFLFLHPIPFLFLSLSLFFFFFFFFFQSFFRLLRLCIQVFQTCVCDGGKRKYYK